MSAAPSKSHSRPPLSARKNRLFTLGIEEEFQIIDPETRELRSHVEQIMEDGKTLLRERVKTEMHQSVVEVGTDICPDVACARVAVTKLRSDLWRLARNRNLTIAASGTHPFSHWIDQKITKGERYEGIVEDMQQVARANLIFGLHVHVGIPDRAVAIQVMNMARYFLPHIFALSTNSPFWLGRNTGFKSYRVKVFERFPRTGIPDVFESLAEYNDYLDLLVKTKCIDNAKKIWWDIRLHPFFDTIEFRVCDIPMRVDETIALAALMQALVSKLHKLLKQNLSWRNYRRRLLDENRWRASRHGLDGKLIDFGKQEEVDTRLLILELLEFVDQEIDEFGSRKEIATIHEILKNGTGADRQLAVWKNTHDLKAVVDHIVAETTFGLKK
ncbi:MAG: carboxylate--amine ligase [Verrucomicrobia bacterium]|nr:carboxylate--amine ligase [Verrucomicrobiota bacterium]